VVTPPPVPCGTGKCLTGSKVIEPKTTQQKLKRKTKLVF